MERAVNGEVFDVTRRGKGYLTLGNPDRLTVVPPGEAGVERDAEPAADLTEPSQLPFRSRGEQRVEPRGLGEEVT